MERKRHKASGNHAKNLSALLCLQCRKTPQENITSEKICGEEPLQWTVTTPLYNIGEHVYNLSDEFKKAHSEIPWIKIAGLWHRLVHHYEDTNWIVICAIIFDVLPEFLEEIKDL